VPSYWYNAVDNSGNFTFGGTCIVPDGNSQQLVLQAVPGSWSPDGTGTIVFNHHYDLTIRGDQLGQNSNDALTITESSAGLQVILNGESFFFDANIDIIDNISVDLGGGTNSLTVDASGDALPENVQIGLDSLGNTKVTGLGPTVYYRNISSLQVNGGQAQNTFTVQDPGWGVAVTLNTGDGDQDQVNVEGTYFGPLTVNLGAGRDFVDICSTRQDLGVILGAVTVHGGNSADATLTVHGRNSSGEYTITAAGISGNAEHAPINYDGIDSLIVQGNSAGNTFDVLDTAGAANTTLDTGDGQNTVSIEKTTGNLTVDFGTGTNTAQITPTSQNLDNIHGALTINGGGGNDTLTLNDQANANSSTWAATGGQVTRSYTILLGGWIPETFTTSVNYSGLTSLVLNAGAGPNTITLSPTAQNLDELPHSATILGFTTPGSVTVHGGGSDTLILDDQHNPFPSTWAASGGIVTRSYTTVVGGLFPETVSASVNYSGLSSLVLNAGSGPNTITLSPTTQDLDELPHSTRILGFTSAGSVTVHGGGNDTLVLDDQNNPQPSTWAVTSGSVTRSYFTVVGGLFPETVTASVNYSGLAGLTLNGGTGGNTFAVQSTAAGTPVTINSAGPDAVTIGNATDGVGDIQGALSLTNNAAAGDYTALTVDDSAYQRGYWISALTPSGLTTAQRTDSGSQVSVAPINFVQSDLSALNIRMATNPVGHGNAVHVINTPSSASAGGLMTTITTGIGAGGAADEIYVEATTGPLTANLVSDWQHIGAGLSLGGVAHTLDNIRGAVTVNTPNGWTDVALDDSGSTTGHTYTVTKNTIAFRPNLPVLTYHVNNEVFLYAGSGVNTINVESTSTATVVNAGLSGNDTINFGGPGKTLQGITGGYLALQIDKPGSHVYLNDQGDTYTQPQTYTFGIDPNFNDGTITRTALGAVWITYWGPLRALTLNATNGNDTFDFQKLPPNHTQLAIKGGTGTNTVVGPNSSNTWLVSGTNSGSLDQIVSFSAVQNLVGGAGVDVFKVAAGKGVTGSINGGAGGDWLDYSAWTTPVAVNLVTGAGTSIAGSVSNIANVRGGSGNDTLTGGGGNILIGGAGSNILVDAYSGSAASGRSLLIGGSGSSSLTAGAAGDILIAGTTSYDANYAALQSILAEWQSADSYLLRFQRIEGLVTGGLNGKNKLVWGSTVKDNDLPGVLNGGAGLDWFFAGGDDTINNLNNPGTEHLDNTR
jgi:hypothetical protein